jgi:hypothetical protein
LAPRSDACIQTLRSQVEYRPNAARARISIGSISYLQLLEISGCRRVKQALIRVFHANLRELLFKRPVLGADPHYREGRLLVGSTGELLAPIATWASELGWEPPQADRAQISVGGREGSFRFQIAGFNSSGSR